jgi:hypothetical protein
MQVSAGRSPRLIMFGNHDAWTCLTARRCKQAWGGGRNLLEGPAAAVAQQMQLVGNQMLAWNHRSHAGHPVSFVGARPFSKVAVQMCETVA